MSFRVASMLTHDLKEEFLRFHNLLLSYGKFNMGNLLKVFIENIEPAHKMAKVDNVLS